MWIVYSLLSALFASLTAVFVKIGVKDIDSDFATAIRTTVVLVLAWGIVFFKGGNSFLNSLSKFNILFLILSGLATGLSWLFYFRALQIGRVSQVVAIDKLSLAITVILAAFFLKEPLTIKSITGAAVMIAGAIIISWK